MRYFSLLQPTSMPSSFFNKLTSSLNIQKEDDNPMDFYQALDDAQAQEPAQQESGMGGEGYLNENESLPKTPGNEGEDSNEDVPEDVEEETDDGAEPAVAHLAMAKSSKGSVRERALPTGRQAHRTLSPMSIEDDDAEGQLAIDVYQTDSEIVIKSVIAGIQPEDLDITIGDDTVSIRGSRKKDEQISNENYYYQECYWGSFSRSVILPVEIDRERAEASFKNGVLTICLPKLEKNRMKKIRIATQ